MSNGRSIKRNMAREQAVRPPSMEDMPKIDQQIQKRPPIQRMNDRPNMLAIMGDEEKMSAADPEAVRKVETINAAMLDMMYAPKTKASVQKMLQSGDPGVTIPATANMVMQRFEDATREKNGPMPLDMRLAVGATVFSEVATLAQAMGLLPEDLTEKEIQPLLQKSLQDYIQRGLKDKTIDPIELQMAVEPLLTDQERAAGLAAAEEQGVPTDVTPQQAAAIYAESKTAPLQAENQNLKKQAKQMSGALQGIAQQPQPQPQQTEGA